MSLLVLLVSIFNFILGYLVYRQNKNNAGFKSFFLLTSTISGWLFFVFLTILSTPNQEAMLQASKMCFLIGSFPPAFFMLFATSYIKNSLKNNLLRLGIFLPAIYFAAISYSGQIVTKVYNALPFEALYGTGFPLFNAYYILCMIIAIGILIYKTKIFPKEKNTLNIIIGGTICTQLIIIITELILPFYRINFLFVLGHFAPVIMNTCIAFAIIKYQALNIRWVIQKSLLYTFILSIILTSTFAISFTFGLYFRLSYQNILLTSLSIALVISLFKTHFQKTIDQIFFKDKLNFEDAVIKINNQL
ncbi:MAG: hypothetical protein KKA19_09700, partial [Candidatus Margulisbacteria bacterium]|nr:hypothetical protein [Candidatus Margulisiibacteriota bacterium]